MYLVQTGVMVDGVVVAVAVAVVWCGVVWCVYYPGPVLPVVAPQLSADWREENK